MSATSCATVTAAAVSVSTVVATSTPTEEAVSATSSTAPCMLVSVPSTSTSASSLPQLPFKRKRFSSSSCDDVQINGGDSTGSGPAFKNSRHSAAVTMTPTLPVGQLSDKACSGGSSIASGCSGSSDLSTSLTEDVPASASSSSMAMAVGIDAVRPSVYIRLAAESPTRNDSDSDDGTVSVYDSSHACETDVVRDTSDTDSYSTDEFATLDVLEYEIPSESSTNEELYSHDSSSGSDDEYVVTAAQLARAIFASQQCVQQQHLTVATAAAVDTQSSNSAADANATNTPPSSQPATSAAATATSVASQPATTSAAPVHHPDPLPSMLAPGQNSSCCTSTPSTEFELFADTEESADSATDPELGRADYWTCVKCKNRQNNPMYRYCERCYQIRKTHFPPRPRPPQKSRSPNAFGRRAQATSQQHIRQPGYAGTTDDEDGEVATDVGRHNTGQRLNLVGVPNAVTSPSPSSRASAAQLQMRENIARQQRLRRQSTTVASQQMQRERRRQQRAEQYQQRPQQPQQPQTSSSSRPPPTNSAAATTEDDDVDGDDIMMMNNESELDAAQLSDDVDMFHTQSSIVATEPPVASQHPQQHQKQRATTPLTSNDSKAAVAASVGSISPVASSVRLEDVEDCYDDGGEETMPEPTDVVVKATTVSAMSSSASLTAAVVTLAGTSSSSLGSTSQATQVLRSTASLPAGVDGVPGGHLPAASSAAAEDVNGMCMMCLSEPKNGVFVHSRFLHLCCCYRCAVKVWNKQKRCPICNCKVKNVMKLFVH